MSPTTFCVALALIIGCSMAQNTQISDHVFGGLEASKAGGTQATLGTNANVFKNDAGERLDARAQISKHFHPSGPTQYGLGLDYAAPKAGASVDVSHAQRMGTVINTSGHANLFESNDRRSRLDAVANYGQQFGPRSRPDFGAGLRFTHRLP